MKKMFAFSFEVFPPKTEKGMQALLHTQKALQQLNPDFFSVTFGAGGALQQKTTTVVKKFIQAGIKTIPHISCVNMTTPRLIELLDIYKRLGIKKLLVIQGDAPQQNENKKKTFCYASELISAIRKISGNYFHLIVAAYPEFHPRAKNPTSDLKYFKEKIDAGANSAITQFFFNSDAYFHFLDSCHKLAIDIPIIPGIIPIHNYQKLLRFANACGAEIPLWLHKRLQSCGDNLTALKELGVECVSKFCESLLRNGINELHFYTLNQIEPTRSIVQQLKRF